MTEAELDNIERALLAHADGLLDVPDQGYEGWLLSTARKLMDEIHRLRMARSSDAIPEQRMNDAELVSTAQLRQAIEGVCISQRDVRREILVMFAQQAMIMLGMRAADLRASSRSAKADDWHKLVLEQYNDALLKLLESSDV